MKTCRLAAVVVCLVLAAGQCLGGTNVTGATAADWTSADLPKAKPLPPVPTTAGCVGPVEVCPHFGGADAAFSLAFDDACVSHLEKAIPLLEKYRVPGTFYLITEAGQFTWKKSEWAKVAKSPYVFLGNHTSAHKGVNAPVELYDQVAAANAVIHELTPDETWPRLVSFGIPGGVPWRISQAQLGEVLSAYDLVERPCFQGPPWRFERSEEAMAYVDRTLSEKTMGHLDFHGIGGDWHVTGLDYFERLLKKLDASRDRIWLCSAIDWHKYVTEAKYARATATGKGNGVYEVSLTVAPLDAKLYDHPLTLCVGEKTLVSLKPGETKIVK